MRDVIRKFEDLTDDEDGVPGVDAAALVGRRIKHRFTEMKVNRKHGMKAVFYLTLVLLT